ncbi:Pup ligase PafA' paralog, possible component of postulated heterodimer PafA-PafA' [hydrothermal vent metagenome]|uniref:Pup ligase PafA' paralog, possible component of postulated heterodimer PafA-PafA n=1 Tax=hydrothermal vent metagenome TaxID=652676 RepID=A0A3B1CIS1_9ZZZZ
MRPPHLFGIETEYGLLHTDMNDPHAAERLSHGVRDHLFDKKRVGLLDMHHRAHDEPAGNGGFLLNGGRFYIDMGHVEYATPECTRLSELVAFNRAGDLLLHQSLEEMGLLESASFIKNNIDYETGATFGAHENYLVSRDFPFTQEGLAQLVPFLTTRQIFSGTGRLGANFVPEGFVTLGDEKFPDIPFQISQRADHIVSDLYQWVQFSRAIINTRDEPLADPERFRRMHLLLGDSNLCEYATALKIGTTALVLDLIHEGLAPILDLLEPVMALKIISRDPTRRWKIRLLDGRETRALDIQRAYLEAAKKYLAGENDDTDWTLQAWETMLNDLEKNDVEVLVGRVDWASKLSLFTQFKESENLDWQDPWLKSLDLEYHNLDPERGLYLALESEGKIARLSTDEAIQQATAMPPVASRAVGRAYLIRKLMEKPAPYVINWASFYLEKDVLGTTDPFKNYLKEAKAMWENQSI